MLDERTTTVRNFARDLVNNNKILKKDYTFLRTKEVEALLNAIELLEVGLTSFREERELAVSMTELGGDLQTIMLKHNLTFAPRA